MRTFASIAWLAPSLLADGTPRRHIGTGFPIYVASPLEGHNLLEAPDNLIHVSQIRSIIHMVHDCCLSDTDESQCVVTAGTVIHHRGRKEWLHVL